MVRKKHKGSEEFLCFIDFVRITWLLCKTETKQYDAENWL